MANNKVFASDIRRSLNKLNNNLFDLLTVNPVTPLPINVAKKSTCDFVPKTDKYFIPKRKIRYKVKTVRDIRNSLETDVYSTLTIDIEKQQNLLLRKIRGGSARDEKTKLLAKNMLKSDKPISRTAWQMLININPHNYTHSSQFVLWNGKRVQVNGSKGGESKFIYKHDLGERRASNLQKHEFRKMNLSTKKNMLKQSLHIKFKPGPLSRKKELDSSYQKYNVGNIELAHLPKPELDILPEYGKPIETTVANFLHNLRDVDGLISRKWAEFAVSALGTYDYSGVVQSNKDHPVTFDLTYKYNQRQLLMRRDDDILNDREVEKNISPDIYTENEDKTIQEIQNILDEMLTAVDISFMQNTMYTTEDSSMNPDTIGLTNKLDVYPKDKVKKRGQSELHRLDVTVIRLHDNEGDNKMDACLNLFCSLGCVCDSIQTPFRLRNHCGHMECMFECKCDFNKYYPRNYYDDHFIPDLISLDHEKVSKLSKEEQKFHQTVILSGEKSILLKNKRRNWKAPEKYAEFYSNLCLKSKKDIKRVLSVVEIKLNCGNVEPWCMIHNLYKCFCKGKFTETISNTVPNDDTKTLEHESDNSKLPLLENIAEAINSESSESNNKTVLRTRNHRTFSSGDKTDAISLCEENAVSLNRYGCARIKAYKKRKYHDLFYSNTNKKIMELEKNDLGLRKRLLEILNIDEYYDMKKRKEDSVQLTVSELSSSPALSESNTALNEITDESPKKVRTNLKCQKLVGDIITTEFTSPAEHNINMRLKAWLEPSLRIYRQRYSEGFFKKSLDPPKLGRIALYPWGFIITRYQEQKNLILVTKQKPFRIFLAVDIKNPFFGNCININTIDDVNKYPLSIRNIIKNEVEHLKDNLCILRGLNFCWELVGSVKKVCDRKSSESENNCNGSPSLSRNIETPSPLSPSCGTTSAAAFNYSSSSPEQNDTEQSKWFVMSIQNDFSEIQFYKRGFFVKYDSIIKAINVARASENTVRLSSQKCNEGNSDTKFGIYAIPNENECCVFIGPYGEDEPLGIETVKTSLDVPNTKTRGVWITTKKVENLQVINNPLSFMPLVNFEYGQILDDIIQNERNTNSLYRVAVKSVVKPKENNKVIKLTKPIKIPKTNNFYHLTPTGVLRPISGSPEKQSSKTQLVFKNSIPHDFTAATNAPLLYRNLLQQSNENTFGQIDDKQKDSTKRPIAEIAPQIKVVKDSNNMQQKTSNRKLEGGMFVLKPDEINNRSLADKICFSSSTTNNFNAISTEANNDFDMDIERFLATSVECSAPTSDDVYVISDDEDYCNSETTNTNDWDDVWVICKNVLNIGWIPGRQDSNKHLSFEFPGFKYTEFYPETKAFAKITQVLSRKIYIPDHLNLIWSVVKTKNDFEKLNLHKLKQEDFYPDCVLTKKGIVHKSISAGLSMKKVKTYSKMARKRVITTSPEEKESDMDLESTKKKIIKLEVESNLLHEKSKSLMGETIVEKAEPSDGFTKMTNDQRQIISDRLRTIISNANFS